MRIGCWLAILVVFAPFTGVAVADEPETQPAPSMRINREVGVIDIDARIVQRDAEWLELIACLPNSREHESLLTVEVPPSEIQVALLLLGLSPGAPSRSRQVGENEWVLIPPRGPEVAVSFLVPTNQEGGAAFREIPANRWVVDADSGQIMEGDTWLFTGSKFETFEEQIDGQMIEQEVYLADENGTVVSLVNFGDDLLARNTTVTRDNDARTWRPNTVLIPPVGTDVVLRLRPLPAQPATSQPATERSENSANTDIVGN